MSEKTDSGALFNELLKTMRKLRAPNGCKWDREQTHESLIKCLQEEAGEVIEAIKNKDDDNLQEELGDLLLQAVFHAAIAEEEGRFNIGEVIDGLNQKLIRRHPHVFGEAKAATPEEALQQWKAIKQKEKELKNLKKSNKQGEN
ncbi:MAG: MazG family protein [Elusimicrobiota bacterium]|jgi:MazG family protein|nr:MazG family protein [Elusimicrobiota bacterium]